MHERAARRSAPAPQVRIKLKLHQKEAELHLLHSLKLGALQRELEERELEAELKEQRQNHIAMHETEQRSKLTLEQERDQKCELIEAESKRVQAADERTTQLSGEIEKLRKKNNKLRSEWHAQNEYCQAKRKNLEAKAEDTRYMLNDARARDEERQAVVQSLLARVAEVEKENQQLQQIITGCEDHMQKHLDAEQKLLEGRPAPAEGSEDAGAGAPQRVAAAAQALQWVLQGKKNEVKRAQASLAGVRADESSELARLEALKKQHAKELADAEAAERALAERVREHEEALAKAAAEEATEKRAVAELETTLAKLAEEKTKLAADQAELVGKCAKLEAENASRADVEEQLKRAEADVGTLGAEIASLEEKDRELALAEAAQRKADESTMADLNSEIAQLTARLAALKQEEGGQLPVGP